MKTAISEANSSAWLALMISTAGFRLNPEHSDNRRDIVPLPASASGTLYSVWEAVAREVSPKSLLAAFRPQDDDIRSIASCFPSFCSIGAILPSRPARGPCRRAQRRSRMARLRATASAARSVLDGREHDGMLDRVGA